MTELRVMIFRDQSYHSMDRGGMEEGEGRGRGMEGEDLIGWGWLGYRSMSIWFGR